MEISKIILISICAALFSVFLKHQRPEFAILITIFAGMIILYIMLPFAVAAVNEVKIAALKLNIGGEYIKTLLKIVGIAYIVQYSAEICKDAGEGALAAKIEMAGKVLLLGSVLPIASALFDTIAKIVP